MKNLVSVTIVFMLFLLIGCDSHFTYQENNNDMVDMPPTEEVLSTLDSTTQDDAAGLAYSDLADKAFVFSSGVGAWFTEVRIHADGTFIGYFNDANMGESGEGYPYGTVYYCSFSGQFSPLEVISPYEYTMKCESLTHEGNLGDETITDGVRYVVSAPYGFDDADTFFLYLPGKRVDELPAAFLDWVGAPRAIDFTNMETIDFWGLYNAAGKQGFSW